MNSLKIGQVLWLKIYYQLGLKSEIKHPMLIADIKENYIEIIALDKAKDKMHRLFSNKNFYINSENPKENVIYVDSYAQLDNRFTIEYYEDLVCYRVTEELLSENKLKELIEFYKKYHENNIIKESRIVHMTKEMIEELNKE